MKKLIYSAVCLLAFALASSAQTYEWADKAGSTGFDYTNFSASDANGNTYATGVYAGKLLLGTATLLQSGADDGFLTKYDASGALTWATRVFGTGNERPISLCIDGSGNVIIGGYYTGTSTAGDASGAGTTSIGTSTSGGFDIFLAKFNSSGAVQWTRTYGSTGTDVVMNLSADVSGNIYAAGYFENTMIFNTSPATTLTSAGGLYCKVQRIGSAAMGKKNGWRCG
jgi:hypothetical protein